MDQPTVRPMRPEDVPAAERVSAEGFFELDRRMHRRGWPEPELRPTSRAGLWVERTLHFLRTDPGGCWVAEDVSGLVGVATSVVREGTWILATYAVRPGHQGRGLGVALLSASLGHGRGCLRGMLSASSDPRAVRRYRLAGFSLHPHMFLSGRVDRTALPAVAKVRDGTPADVDLLDSVDRQIRGAAHGPDHELLLRRLRLLVSDTSTGSGYAFLDPAGATVRLLAATNRRTAARLLWAALADTPPGAQVTVEHITPANEWALDVGLAARLEVHQEGYLALRGLRPPAPYLPHGSVL